MSTVLSASEIDQALEKLPGWGRRGKAIERVFQFDNFLEAMEFVNKIAVAAEAANHHPRHRDQLQQGHPGAGLARFWRHHATRHSHGG